MYNPTTNLNEKTVTDTVPLDAVVSDESKRIVQSLCLFCEKGRSGMTAILQGQKCEEKILEEGKYEVFSKQVNNAKGNVLRIEVTCSGFVERGR